MSLFDGLQEKLTYLDKNQIEQIYRAYLLAEEAHFGQERDSGDPYLGHPIAVAGILAGMHLDYQSIIASLLHDVVEDTSVSKEVIKNNFGEVVAALVDGVTKLSQIEFLSRAEAQAESFRKMVLAMSRDIRVILIKLADRLHNMQTLQALSKERRCRIAQETLDIYAPIANRLGMHRMFTELEDLSFKAYNPWRYKIISEAVVKMRSGLQDSLQNIRSEIEKELLKNSITDVSILSREKHLYSLYRRMQKKGCSLVEVANMYAFRVIVPNNISCYMALGLIHGIYKPIVGRFEDYVALPKLNGYQSLHTAVFGPQGAAIEIQIRTPAMDQMANYGMVMHWLQPRTSDAGEQHVVSPLKTQRWISNLLEMQQHTDSSLEFIDNVKTDLFPEEIFVFTPRGNIIELPKGATVVDFAYAVHTDVGNTCVAAKIDGQFMPLSSMLKSGQTVAIITMPEAKPNPSWLDFVTTGRARGSIRSFLKGQKLSEIIELGKQLLDKALTNLGSSLKKISSKSIRSVLAANKLESVDYLYEEIGLGNSVPLFIAYQLVNLDPKNIAEQDLKEAASKTKPLMIKGAEGLAIQFAPCCHPIPGDPILGYLQIGHGLQIHRTDCSHLIKLKKRPEMCIPVLWSDDIKETFSVAITVDVADKRGVLAALAQAVALAEANIEDVNIKERSSAYCSIRLVIKVKNLDHLERILRHIAAIPTVINVMRVKG
ncbi:MAG: bifunctional (p)ppGpp synthetase/guanosine-3',5'-bis(diphosphate) 3'-pyrophosphohydrolase [Gammaproteobacteria bacterium]